MNAIQLNELAAIIDKHTANEGTTDSPIPGLQLFKSTVPNLPTPTVFNPSLCLLVQGQKQVLLHNDIYPYTVSEFLVVSVDLPVTGKVTVATPDTPYLALKIDIDVSTLSELLLSMDNSLIQSKSFSRGLNVAKADHVVADSILRMLRMLDTPKDIPVLSSNMMREILYRVLQSEYGHLLASITFKGSHIERISNAIRAIKKDFNKPLTVNSLAEIAGMSVSGFHAHFKTVTSMSPLQFQKQLRLIEARHLMLSENMDAAAAAYQVGYESASQFSREYVRMFGTPPKRDINNLKI
ncbi:MAG: AraC family transcriptional regulator CmrA [Rickettsiales bacterium]|nr:AraC family transcriptional regulator CmrA [Rickettsiales bacterium]|tara:strand:- start:7924 stop:8808 length:885 start_codon:yes stop_codon:yes gene_type:complete